MPREIVTAPRGGSRLARAAVLAALALGSFAVGGGLCEGLLRATGAYAPVEYHRAPPSAALHDVQTNWDLTYHTNSIGLRDREHDRARPPGITSRILLVGDSFTFGQGVEADEGFAPVLEGILRSRGHSAEVVNLSAIGIGPESYFMLLRDIGAAYSPDVVVVNVFGNDGSYDESPSLPRQWLRALSRHSHVFSLLRILRQRSAERETARLVADPDRFWERLVKACAGHRPEEECRETVRSFRGRFGSRVNNLAASCLSDPDEVRREVVPERGRAGFRDLSRYVAAMRDVCRGVRCRMALGLIPDGAQVDPAQVEVRKLLGVSYPEDVRSGEGAFQRAVGDLARGLDLPVYDPLATFRGKPDGLYFPADFHFTPAGHRLYAEGLADFLERGGFLSTGRGGRQP